MRLSRPALIAAVFLAVPALAAKPSSHRHHRSHPAPAATPSPAPSPTAAATPTPEEQRAALNQAESEKAQKQVDENTARQINNSEASKTYEAAKAQHDAQVKAYEEALVKWKADTAACQAGDRTRCGTR